VRVLISSTWGYGHVFPMVPLARALVAAGHQVLWAGLGGAPGLARAAGIDARPVGLTTAQVADVERRLRGALAGVAPPDRASVAFPTMFGEWVTPSTVRDLLPLARDWRPDLLVHEHAELAAPLVAAVLGVVSVTHSFGGAVPAAFLSEAGERVRGVWAEHDVPLAPYAGCCTGPYLDICPPAVQTVPLDHLGDRHRLRPMGYTGEPGPRPAALDDDERPLVYLTLGTVQNKTGGLGPALAGVRDLPVRVLVAVGPDADPADLGEQPGNVTVERWVPQAQVLAQASVVVSHAGSGTFLGALAQGLPQLCLPQGGDQFRNATGAVASGTGLVLAPHQITPDAVRTCVRQLLDDASFRSAARVVAADVAATPSPADVVLDLEQLTADPPDPDGRLGW
jgi:UDP:flavonoid glycosyltransferase YjiC (YdhE family)